MVEIGPGMRDRRNDAGALVSLGWAGVGGIRAGDRSSVLVGAVVAKYSGTFGKLSEISKPGAVAFVALGRSFSLLEKRGRE